jgi:hypothetical protein
VFWLMCVHQNLERCSCFVLAQKNKSRSWRVVKVRVIKRVSFLDLPRAWVLVREWLLQLIMIRLFNFSENNNKQEKVHVVCVVAINHLIIIITTTVCDFHETSSSRAFVQYHHHHHIRKLYITFLIKKRTFNFKQELNFKIDDEGKTERRKRTKYREVVQK